MATKRKRASPEPAPAPPGPEVEKEAVEAVEAEDVINDPSIYRVHKRLPMRDVARKNDIYVSRETRFGALKRRAISLLDGGAQFVTLYAMGAAITRCCQLALEIQKDVGGAVVIGLSTCTVDVYDDYQPLVEGYPEVTKTRSKSAVRIKLTRTEDYV